MSNFPTDSILILDLETNGTDPNSCRMRYFGAYSYKNGKRYYLKEKDMPFIQDMIAAHEVIVGFNTKKFDVPILKRYGCDFFGKIQVDLWEIMAEAKINPKTKVRTEGKGRGPFLVGRLKNWKLATIAKALDLGEAKGEIDYNILKKEPEEWTIEEERLIVEYLAQDISVTKRLFEVVHNFFYPLTEFLNEKNIRNWSYLTASIASVAYKIVCNLADLPETYADNVEGRDKVKGAKVFDPTRSEYVGPIVVLDYNSLYPSIFRMFNLCSLADKDTPEDEVFAGNDFYKIEGRYKCKELGKIERVIERLYHVRKEYKKNKDKREQVVKIIINGFFGTTGNPVFEQVYKQNGISAKDCLTLGRIIISYSQQEFERRGYIFLYGDTDSQYLGLNGHTVEEAIADAKEIAEFLKSKAPLPHEDFGFGLDGVLDAVWFFPFEDGTYKKKNYMYVIRDKENNPKLKVKGLPLVKRGASELAKVVFWKYMVPEILRTLKPKFIKGNIKQWIEIEFEKNPLLVARDFNVRDFNEYKDNPNGLSAQISKQLGMGVWSLIPNKRKIGIGKSKYYCTIEEYQKRRLTIHDIDLTLTWNNLEPFIKSEQTGLGDF